MYKYPTFSSYSFGCRVNEAERVEMDKKMIRAGFSKNELKPDVYIINSCAVTAKAEREARQLVLRLKKHFPLLKLVVTGCSATYWQKNGLWQNMPIDLIISNIDKEYAVSLILKRFYPRRKGSLQAQSEAMPYQDKFLDSGRVMVKIQDGCHRFCSYCIVPYLRGLPKSRSIRDIASSVREYSGNMKEAILTAINTEAFGKDSGETLEELIRTVLAETGISRLSFGSLHPWSLTPEFMRLYESVSQEDRFSRFFHIPLQSGSDRMLSLMKRDYTTGEMLLRLHDLKRIQPDTLLATDVIVGFLDESDADFEDTYRFFEKAPFSKLHVFRFSKRQNTVAAYLAKRLAEPSPADKTKRSHALLQLSARKYGEFLETQIGKTGPALFIGEPENGSQKALLANQLPVVVPVVNTLSGNIKHVTITRLKAGVLFGKVV